MDEWNPIILSSAIHGSGGEEVKKYHIMMDERILLQIPGWNDDINYKYREGVSLVLNFF